MKWKRWMSMKKKTNKFFIAFGYAFRFIDKKVIIPITKLTIRLKNNIEGDGYKIERYLNRKSSLLVISLILAYGIFLFVDSKSIAMLETSAEVLYNQDVSVIYNEEAYVLEGIPDSVDITLIGRKSDLYLAKQIPEHEVVVDLSGLGPGTHKVDVKYRRVVESINYKIDPSVVSVTIYPKVSGVKSVTVDVLNKDKLDPKLIVKSTMIDRDEVIIKGSEATIGKVASVKALIDVNSLVNPTVGTVEMEDIPLVAYDEKGYIVDVEIVPTKINASITIESPSKKVPIKVIPAGAVTFGKAISEITSSVAEVTIYGDEAILEGITYVPVEIDVSGLKSDKEYSVNIKKPVGVRGISATTTTVSIKLGDEVTKEFSGIMLEYKNLASNLRVTAKTEQDALITVVVKGVAEILDKLDANTIKPYVDLSGYTAGEHSITVGVEQSNLLLTYLPKTKTVTLIIKQK